MECIKCENCKQNQPTYFCFARNEIVINSQYTVEDQRVRMGWKKGHPSYESHRRKLKKSEVEV